MEKKPCSAPLENNTDGVGIDRKALHRRSTGNCKHKRKSIKMPSSSSLHSLVSILKPSTDSNRRSVPNVSFDEEYNNIKMSESKSSVIDDKTNPSFDDSTSQYHSALDGGDAGCFKSMNNHAEGSISTQQSSTIGFRASFFSVLEKLGVLRSEDLYKAPATDSRFTSDKRIGRNSVSSLYFRAVYGGKFFMLSTIFKLHSMNFLCHFTRRPKILFLTFHYRCHCQLVFFCH